jgi:5-methylcytosine-specific restriction endonuclease McrA
MTDDERRARNREKQARWRLNHPERSLASGRASVSRWRAANPEKSAAAIKANYAKHREAYLARAKEKRAQRSDTEREKERQYRLKTRARDNAKRTERRNANPEACRRKEAERRENPEYRARAVARTAEWNRKHPERARALRRKQDAKRRAVERECFVEYVDHRVVFERDKGICGICRKRVNLNSQWEIDHVIPICRGGAHAYANVQLAHPRCNRSKFTKVPKGQPTLFQVVA